MKKLLQTQPLNGDLAILILRLLFGALFVYYGMSKINMYSAISGVFPNYLGIGGPGTFCVVITAELGGGLLILLGLFTRLAVIPVFITMVVAFFVAHANDPFDVKQIALVYMILCPVIFLLGSGKYSLDKVIKH